MRVKFGEHTVDVRPASPAENLALPAHGLSLDDCAAQDHAGQLAKRRAPAFPCCAKAKNAGSAGCANSSAWRSSGVKRIPCMGHASRLAPCRQAKWRYLRVRRDVLSVIAPHCPHSQNRVVKKRRKPKKNGACGVHRTGRFYNRSPTKENGSSIKLRQVYAA